MDQDHEHRLTAVEERSKSNTKRLNDVETRHGNLDKEKSSDFITLLGALPPGQVKNLLKNEVCWPILKKYGITGV